MGAPPSFVGVLPGDAGQDFLSASVTGHSKGPHGGECRRRICPADPAPATAGLETGPIWRLIAYNPMGYSRLCKLLSKRPHLFAAPRNC